jgi:hypothetical protein
MERLRFIEHKGGRILLMDNSANSKDEAYAMFDAFDSLVRSQPRGSLRVLCDFEGCYHDVGILGKWKKASEEHQNYIVKSANLGITGSFRIAMAAYRFFARLKGVPIDSIMRDFSDEEQAKDWLLE